MIVLILAFRDVQRDLKTFLGLAVALAAALTPILVLMALKAGITGALFDELARDPATLQIRFLSEKTLPLETQQAIANLPGVGFVAPLPRHVGTVLELIGTADRTSPVTLLTSGSGDPTLAPAQPPGPRDIVLSTKVARELDVSEGAQVLMVLENAYTNVYLELPLRVTAVAPRLSGSFSLVDANLAFIADAVKTGRSVPGLALPGKEASAAVPEVTRLRLYAAGLRDVEPLTQAVSAMGYDVDSEWARIASVERLQRNLEVAFAIIATFAAGGYTIALAISLWVNVERKRRSLAMLRLMGTSAGKLMLFPLAQAFVVAVVGSGFALALFAMAGSSLNRFFAGALPAGASVVGHPTGEMLVLLSLTAAAAVLAGLAGGAAVIRMEPREAMRDG